jgi:hypothetical protein
VFGLPEKGLEGGTGMGFGAFLLDSVEAPWHEAIGTTLHPPAPRRHLIGGPGLRHGLGGARWACRGGAARGMCSLSCARTVLGMVMKLGLQIRRLADWAAAQSSRSPNPHQGLRWASDSNAAG